MCGEAFTLIPPKQESASVDPGSLSFRQKYLALKAGDVGAVEKVGRGSNLPSVIQIQHTTEKGQTIQQKAIAKPLSTEAIETRDNQEREPHTR